MANSVVHWEDFSRPPVLSFSTVTHDLKTNGTMGPARRGATEANRLAARRRLVAAPSTRSVQATAVTAACGGTTSDDIHRERGPYSIPPG